MGRAMRQAPVRARLDVVRRSMSASEAFAAILTTCLDHLEANRPGALRGSDPEYLHQARVALRRLQSGLIAFKRLGRRGALRSQAKPVRVVLRALGPARDWDVFIEHALAPVLARHPGHAGLRSLEAACAQLRLDAHLAARNALASRRYRKMVRSLRKAAADEAWLSAKGREADVREHAAQVLERYRQRVLKRARGIDCAGLRRLHKLRIATKKLRYAAGFFSPLFPRQGTVAMLGGLNDLQDLLGAINDCASAPALLGEATRAAAGPQRRQARKMIEQRNSEILEKKRAELGRAWRNVDRAPLFWR